MLPDAVTCKQSPLWETNYESQHFNTIFCLFFVYLNFLSEFCCISRNLNIELNSVMRYCYLSEKTTVNKFTWIKLQINRNNSLVFLLVNCVSYAGFMQESSGRSNFLRALGISGVLITYQQSRFSRGIFACLK